MHMYAVRAKPNHSTWYLLGTVPRPPVLFHPFSKKSWACVKSLRRQSKEKPDRNSDAFHQNRSVRRDKVRDPDVTLHIAAVRETILVWFWVSVLDFRFWFMDWLQFKWQENIVKIVQSAVSTKNVIQLRNAENFACNPPKFNSRLQQTEDLCSNETSLKNFSVH